MSAPDPDVKISKVERDFLAKLMRRLRFFGPERQHLSLETDRGHAFLAASLNAHNVSNGYWDGAAWHPFDLTRPAYLLDVAGVAGELQFYTCAAGVDPITWTELWSVGAPGGSGGVGTIAEVINVADVAVAAATLTQIVAPLSLNPGWWILSPTVSILNGAAAGMFQGYLRVGAARQNKPATWNLAANGWWGGPLDTHLVGLTATTSFNVAAFCSVAMTAKWTAPNFASLATGLRAMRIG